MTLGALARRLPAARLAGAGTVRFASVSIDSRSLAPGALYVALRGARHDGHDFAAQAQARGAVALLLEQPSAVDLPQLLVPDSRRALALAAADWRARFTLPLIAVTGSNGKTTLTQMIAAVLARALGERAGRRNWLATRGNLNNDIGVPLMLLELAAHHKAAVLELGMNHPGEIAWLVQLARPTVAVVNNAQREHQEFMATVAATAEENGCAIASLPPDGTAVFPADDPCVAIWRRLAGTRRVLDFALHEAAAVTAEFTLRPQGSRMAIATPSGLIETELAVAGEHNVRNALAATACCLAIGVAPAAIGAGLAAFTPVAGRGVWRPTLGGATVIDDTYNANPDSVRAAIELLARQSPPRALLLGDMGEVGDRGEEFHREVGALARERGIERLLGLGSAVAAAVAAFGAGALHCPTVEALIEAARGLDVPGACLLVKGSRFMRMERVVAALAAPAGTGP